MNRGDDAAAHTDPAEEADLFLGPFEDESPAATNDFKCPQPSGESVAARDKPDRRRGGIPQEGQTDALPAGVQAGPTPSHSTGVGHQSSAAQRYERALVHAARYPKPTHPTLRGRLERLISPPNLGSCFRCGRPWRGEIAHYTRYTDGGGSCFPLCESCWSSLTPSERLPYYERLVDMWIGQMPEEAEGYEAKRDLIREAVLDGR